MMFKLRKIGVEGTIKFSKANLLFGFFVVMEILVLCRFRKHGPTLEYHIRGREKLENCKDRLEFLFLISLGRALFLISLSRDRLEYQWVESALLQKYAISSS